MKVVILAGGLGTRLSEETQVKPKPMAEIGEHPILWHIMKIYGEQGFTDFVVCLGYKGYVIKEYFANYFLHNSDVTFDLQGQCMEVHENTVEPWRVTLVDTGADTQTGGRLKRVAPYVADETFMMTYGDGVADVDLGDLLAFHEEQGRLATVTAVQPPGRFGALRLDDDGHVRAGLRREARGRRRLDERRVLRAGAARCSTTSTATRRCGSGSRSSAWRATASWRRTAIDGFWQPMDTLRDKRTLEELWESGDAPWKTLVMFGGGVSPAGESSSPATPASRGRG